MNTESHPMRVRGLKPRSPTAVAVILHVAPHAGAWIETNLPMGTRRSSTSHPMRVRGLKLPLPLGDDARMQVAPHAGAWIETLLDAETNTMDGVSHPMRVRGLKPFLRIFLRRCLRSHPMRVRGLKHDASDANILDECVAPHAGAWIETPYGAR